MSVCEGRVMGIPSKMMERGFSNVLLKYPSVVSDLSLGKSIRHSISLSPLRMINSIELLVKSNASSPN